MANTLTLISLVALLVALALPALDVQLERARRTRCLGNERAIWAAMSLYASDFRGWFPAMSALGRDGSARRSRERARPSLFAAAEFGIHPQPIDLRLPQR